MRLKRADDPETSADFKDLPKLGSYGIAGGGLVLNEPAGANGLGRQSMLPHCVHLIVGFTNFLLSVASGGELPKRIPKSRSNLGVMHRVRTTCLTFAGAALFVMACQ